MGLFFNKHSNIIKEVKDFLENDLVISKQACGKSEKSVENSLVCQLQEKFGEDFVHRQRSIGENFKMKCDVDLFSGGCGIELKLASSLENKADEFHRAIGQIACYAHEHYITSGVILLVVGKEPEMSEKIDELRTIVNHFPRVHFVYKQAQNKKSKK